MRTIQGQAFMVTRMVKRTDRWWVLGAASSLCLALLGTSSSALAKGAKKDEAKAEAKDEAKKDEAKAEVKTKKEKKGNGGPVDELVEKYRQARAPKADNPAIVTLSPDDCKSFAKD